MKNNFFDSICCNFRVCIEAKNVPQIENWFKACAGTIYQAEATFLGGGGLHFSNWRGRNTEYFVMIRMALGMQIYGAGKLSPTQYQTLAPVLAQAKNGLRPKP